MTTGLLPHEKSIRFTNTNFIYCNYKAIPILTLTLTLTLTDVSFTVNHSTEVNGNCAENMRWQNYRKL